METSVPGTGDGYRVETPEQLDLQYDVAGLGSRLLAAMVDTLIVTLLLLVLGVLGTIGLASAAGAIVASLGAELSRTTAFLLALAAVLLLCFAVVVGYYIFFELVWHGQSPGKRWVGLRVIKEGGYPIGFVDSALRNTVRLVDFLPFYYSLGAVVMLIDGRSRRLGDLAAGTLVVKERRDVTLETLTLIPDVDPPDKTRVERVRQAGYGAAPEASNADSPDSPWGKPAVPNLDRLTHADESLLREYLVRRETLTQPAAAALAAHLATAFTGKLDHDLAGEPPESFLARLARQLGGGTT